MRKKLPNISEGIETLKAEMRKTSDVHRNQKLMMLYHLKSGYAKTRREAADLIGVHPKTVGTWLTVYETDGLEAMLHRGTPTGRPPLLTPAQADMLRSKLQEVEGFASYTDIQEYIQHTLGVKMSYKGVYSLGHDRWKAKPKVPRKTHEKKNVSDAEDFAATLGAQVKAACAQKPVSKFKSTRLFSQDESRFGLLGCVQRRITVRGTKPIASVCPKYESIYLYGAVEPRTGAHFYLEFSGLTSDCFQYFLEAFSEAFPESLNVLVLDNGRFHLSDALEVPENVALLFLPPYSPELNPIERVWQYFKQRLFRDTYSSLETLQAGITAILKETSEAAISKMTSFPFFIDAAKQI